MNTDNQIITKDEKQWLEEAKSDVAVEELAIDRAEEPDSKLLSFGNKIITEVDTINLAVISFLAFLISAFLTIVTLTEESLLLFFVTSIFYIIWIFYAFEWFKRLRSAEKK